MKTLDTSLLFRGGQQVGSLVWLMQKFVDVVDELLDGSRNGHGDWVKLQRKLN
jgi:hypothetical protein